MKRLIFFSNPKNLIQCLWIFIFFTIVACTQPPQTSIEPTKPALPEPATKTVIPATTEAHNTPVESQTEPIQTPEFQSTQTPQIISVTEIITVTSTPSLDNEEATGRLFVFQTSGIYQINLPEKEMTPLFETEKGYKNWGARFAQNKKLLAYWIRQDDETELWFTSLSDWQPELLFIVDDLEYDFATPLWGVNDRYLFFKLSVTDDSGPLEDIKTVGTYIVDTKTMDLVGTSYWPGDCSILAPSSHSEQLALWCHQSDDQNQEYLVLEPAQSPWFTKESPVILFDKCLIYAMCDWSQDGELVVYINMDKHPDEMFYSSVPHPEPIQISDDVSDIYSFPLWSPNNQYLFYAGDCVNGGAQNPTVLNVLDEKITWCVADTSNRGEFGLMSTPTVTWSPNSNFIAIPIMPDVEEEILIFDVLTQEEWGRISNLGGIIRDMVWVNE